MRVEKNIQNQRIDNGKKGQPSLSSGDFRLPSLQTITFELNLSFQPPLFLLSFGREPQARPSRRELVFPDGLVQTKIVSSFASSLLSDLLRISFSLSRGTCWKRSVPLLAVAEKGNELSWAVQLCEELCLRDPSVPEGRRGRGAVDEGRRGQPRRSSFDASFLSLFGIESGLECSQ